MRLLLDPNKKTLSPAGGKLPPPAATGGGGAERKPGAAEGGRPAGHDAGDFSPECMYGLSFGRSVAGYLEVPPSRFNFVYFEMVADQKAAAAVSLIGGFDR